MKKFIVALTAVERRNFTDLIAADKADATEGKDTSGPNDLKPDSSVLHPIKG